MIDNFNKKASASTDMGAEHFIFDKEDDTYTCTQGKILSTNGFWYNTRTRRGNII